eukprot:271265-Rhodomonas_salina.2
MMCGTELAYGGIRLRACYAMTCADLAYAPMQCALAVLSDRMQASYGPLTPYVAHLPLAPSTELAYGATTACRLDSAPSLLLSLSSLSRLRFLVAPPSVLRARYAMSGTDLGCGILLRLRCAIPSTATDYAPTLALRHSQYWHAQSPYAGTTRCADLGHAIDLLNSAPAVSSYRPTRLLRDVRLRACYAMSGTETGYGPISLRACYAMSDTGLAHAVLLAHVLHRNQVASAIALRASHAMSGTELEYGAIALRASFAMSGTEPAYGATRRSRASA